jgi:uncharacterized protein YbjT (DUF2867 family)
MRLLVLGASGGCGQWLLRLAAERRHDVMAVVRPETSFKPPAGIDVFRGEVTDPETLHRVLPGHDAVLSALGLRRAHLLPWAPLRSPPDLTTRVARILTLAMQRHGVARLVAISAGGVGDSVGRLTWLVRQIVKAGNVGVAYRDLASMEAVLAGSALDWMVARPVTLVNGPPRSAAREVERYSVLSTVRRSEVAMWMLDAVERPTPFVERHMLLGH